MVPCPRSARLGRTAAEGLHLDYFDLHVAAPWLPCSTCNRIKWQIWWLRKPTRKWCGNQHPRTFPTRIQNLHSRRRHAHFFKRVTGYESLPLYARHATLDFVFVGYGESFSKPLQKNCTTNQRLNKKWAYKVTESSQFNYKFLVYVIVGTLEEQLGFMEAMQQAQLLTQGIYFVVGVYLEQYRAKDPAKYLLGRWSIKKPIPLFFSFTLRVRPTVQSMKVRIMELSDFSSDAVSVCNNKWWSTLDNLMCAVAQRVSQPLGLISLNSKKICRHDALQRRDVASIDNFFFLPKNRKAADKTSRKRESNAFAWTIGIHFAPFLGGQLIKSMCLTGTFSEKVKPELVSAFQSFLGIIASPPKTANLEDFTKNVNFHAELPPFSFTWDPSIPRFVRIEAAYLHDAVMLYAHALDTCLRNRTACPDPHDGQRLLDYFLDRSYQSAMGYDAYIDRTGVAQGNYSLLALRNSFVGDQEQFGLLDVGVFLIGRDRSGLPVSGKLRLLSFI